MTVELLLLNPSDDDFIDRYTSIKAMMALPNVIVVREPFIANVAHPHVIVDVMPDDGVIDLFEKLRELQEEKVRMTFEINRYDHDDVVLRLPNQNNPYSHGGLRKKKKGKLKRY